MKTRKVNSPSILTSIALIAILISAACSDKKSNNEGAQSGVKAPDVEIHTAVVTGNEEALKQHIAAGSNLNERDPFGGSSPLISAAVFGKPEMAQILIDAGADINFQNNDGSTALHSSAFFCRPEIVKMLLDKGADKSIKNKFGATAYESVTPAFGEVKGIYEMMQTTLSPMGLNLDFAYIEKTRPEIAAMLK